MTVWIYVHHVFAGTQRSLIRRQTDALEQMLQLWSAMRILGIEPNSSGRAVNALHCAITLTFTGLSAVSSSFSWGWFCINLTNISMKNYCQRCSLLHDTPSSMTFFIDWDTDSISLGWQNSCHFHALLDSITINNLSLTVWSHSLETWPWPNFLLDPKINMYPHGYSVCGFLGRHSNC